MPRVFLLSAVVFLIACGGRTGAIPGASNPGEVPYSATTGRTYAIATVEQYPDGQSLVQHPLGDSAASKLQRAGWTGARYRDAEVIPSLFTGEREFPDLLVYGGHGTHAGPALTTDPERTMVPANYFWGGSPTKPLRWFFNDSCIGLNDGVSHPEDQPRWEAVPGSYWYLGVWLQAMHWGRQGMHAYLGHRGIAWANQANSGSAYAIARSLQGVSVGQAWFEAAAQDLALGVQGDLPAVLSAYDPGTGTDWFDESLAAPWPDPLSPVVASSSLIGNHQNLAYHFMVIGVPVLPAASLKVSGMVQGRFRTTQSLVSGNLEASPHSVRSSGETVDILLQGQGPALETLIRAASLDRPAVELRHYVQRGEADPILLGSLVSLRGLEGDVLILHVDADGRIQRATILKSSDLERWPGLRALCN